MLQTETEPKGIARSIPILSWLPEYKLSWLRGDILAGLVAAAVVIPQAMAYASIAGLPMQVGLYVALAPMLVYVVLGSSRPLSVSSTSTISMLVSAQLLMAVGQAEPEAYIVPAATLAFLVGIFLLLASLFRLGFIANFISLPVLTGFKAGIGVVIFVGQLGKVLGISVEKGPIFHSILDLVENLGQTHFPSLALALVSIGVMVLLPRFNKRIPAPLAVVALGILASVLLNLETKGVKLVGAIPSGLPEFNLPDWSLVESLWPGALGIALMSFVESIASARAFHKHGDPPVDANQELFALGAANLAGSFTQSYPAGGGTSQTAVNAQSGAKSQIAEAVTATVVLVTLLFLSPLIALMPQATLGALVLVAAIGLIRVGEFNAIARLRRVEFRWALLTALGVVFLGTLRGIFVAIIFSMLDLIYHANRPSVYLLGRKPGTDVFRPLGDHPEDETLPGLAMLRTEGRLYFANAPRALENMWPLIREANPKVLALDLSRVPDIEYTALNEIAEFEERLAGYGIELWLVALNPAPLQIVQRSHLGEKLQDGRMLFNLQQAFEIYQEKYK